MIKIICSTLLFILTVGLGILLSKLGKPYNSIIFNLHKLIALFGSVFMVIIIYNNMNNFKIKSIIIILTVVIILLIITLFVSGALLSSGNLPHNTLKIIHDIAATLIAIIILIVFYYFIKMIKV